MIIKILLRVASGCSLFCLAAILSSVNVRAETLSPAAVVIDPGIAAVMDKSRYRHARWGLLAVDVASGEVVQQLHADEFFMPASTTKMFTVAAALEAFSAEHRITTPVYRHGEVDSAGVLQGDLIVVGAGDITLGGRRGPDDSVVEYTEFDHIYANFADGAVLTQGDPLSGLNQLAQQIAASGIKHIAGDVMVDDRLFETDEPRPGLIASPLSINENLVDIILTPAAVDQIALLDWRPQTQAFVLDNQVKTVAAGEPTVIEIHEESISAGQARLLIRGQLPAARAPAVRVHPIRQPANVGRVLFIEALERVGVSVASAKLSANPLSKLPAREQLQRLPQVAALDSPPLAEFGKLILKVSHNQGAEMLPLLIAAKYGDYRYDQGMRRLGAILSGFGIDASTYSFGDGAGGDSNRTLPSAAIALLRTMNSRPDSEIYRNALPILGVNGSIGKDEINSPAAGKVYAKTGTGVTSDATHGGFFLTTQALAGYIDAANGRRLAFALYVNNVLLNETDDPIFGDMAQTSADLSRIAALIWQLNNTR